MTGTLYILRFSPLEHMKDTHRGMLRIGLCLLSSYLAAQTSDVTVFGDRTFQAVR